MRSVSVRRALFANMEWTFEMSEKHKEERVTDDKWVFQSFPGYSISLLCGSQHFWKNESEWGFGKSSWTVTKGVRRAVHMTGVCYCMCEEQLNHYSLNTVTSRKIMRLSITSQHFEYDAQVIPFIFTGKQTPLISHESPLQFQKVMYNQKMLCHSYLFYTIYAMP